MSLFSIQTSESTSNDCMNEDWKASAPGSYTLKYRHFTCTDTDIFSVLCVTMGGTLIIYGLYCAVFVNTCTGFAVFEILERT